MRKLIVLASLLVAITGCAWIKEQVGYIQWCKGDEICWTESISKAKSAGEKAGDIASLSPVPAASNIAKSVVGYASLVFFLIQGGRKLKKKNELNS